MTKHVSGDWPLANKKHRPSLQSWPFLNPQLGWFGQLANARILDVVRLVRCAGPAGRSWCPGNQDPCRWHGVRVLCSPSAGVLRRGSCTGGYPSNARDPSCLVPSRCIVGAARLPVAGCVLWEAKVERYQLCGKRLFSDFSSPRSGSDRSFLSSSCLPSPPARSTGR